MTDGPVSTIFAELKRAARERLDSTRLGKPRVTVQVGHCSRSVGAGEVAEALADDLPDSAYLVVAGCDGACFDAPRVMIAGLTGDQRRYSRVAPESARQMAQSITSVDTSSGSEVNGFLGGQRRITLDRCGEMDATGIDEYISNDGYAGLARALEMSPEEVIEEVTASGLRGRGGAYFPAAAKWRGARSVEGAVRYLVVNCEEGEPGVFKDRHLMEGVPHRILEGAIIAAYASGVSQSYVYINAEAELSAQRVIRAIDQACEMGLLGDDILGSGYSLDLEVRRGAGGYVCGEETTLLNTMEGYRREPRLRPPFPTEAGLWARPTVINNAETLAAVPFIMANGAESFRQIGTESDSGTKIMSLSGSVQRPGLAEVPMGTTLRQVIYEVGGGPPAGTTLTAVAVGGPSSGMLPLSMLDTPIRGGPLHESGVMLGAGGVVALDERINPLELVRSLAAYNAAESCGKCTPCREGTPRMVEAVDRLASEQGLPADLEELRYLAQVVNATSLCGLGQAAGNPILSALHFFGDDFAKQAGVS